MFHATSHHNGHKPRFALHLRRKGRQRYGNVRRNLEVKARYNTCRGVSIPGKPHKIADLSWFSYEFGGVVRYGEILAAGNDPLLDSQKNLLHYGADIGVWFVGIKGTAAEKLKLQLYHSYL